MAQRTQRTIERPVEVSGVGFLSGADIRLRFLPAPADRGITFVRTDRPEAVVVPARVEFTAPRARRTALEYRGVTIEMVEHVMAALAGLQIDNCQVELNAPEPPGCDGSSQAFADALLEAGSVDLGVPRELLVIQRDVSADSHEGAKAVSAFRTAKPGLVIGYDLDYGPDSPIPAQSFELEITPESFLKELAFARTFILESEANELRAQGYGKRTTARDLLIYGPQGVIDNELRAADECVRHKVLDCLGDLALIGCDVSGRLEAFRSGHRLNGEIVRRLQLAHQEHFFQAVRHAA
jgi:UDP-3-O-acyl N-acetylglucosamine deacetylase